MPAKSLQSCPILCNPVDSNLPLFCPWNSPGKSTGVGCHDLLQEILPTQESNPGFLHCRQSPSLQMDSLPTEPPGKPQNAGMGSLSLLQWIFLIQESNRGLLHCGWILSQLSHQGRSNPTQTADSPSPCSSSLSTTHWGKIISSAKLVTVVMSGVPLVPCNSVSSVCRVEHDSPWGTVGSPSHWGKAGAPSFWHEYPDLGVML